jgi:ubiquinone/menaquinone biosynthesis C-methylase UbiE
MIPKFIYKLLEVPQVFELQQKICNNYSSVKNEFLKYLIRKNIKIIDIGCSTGLCGRTLFDLNNPNYVGIDLDPQYIRIAKEKRPYGSFFVADAQDLSFQLEGFDLAALIGVLHHMSDEVANKTMKEVARVLKPDGFVLIAEPVFTKKSILSTFFLSHDRGRFIRTREKYEELFAQFETVKQGYFSFSIHRFVSFVLKPKAQATEWHR